MSSSTDNTFAYCHQLVTITRFVPNVLWLQNVFIYNNMNYNSYKNNVLIISLSVVLRVLIFYLK